MAVLNKLADNEFNGGGRNTMKMPFFFMSGTKMGRTWIRDLQIKSLK